MEAPEKLYFTANEKGTHYYTEGIPFDREYVEYTRTDAFIDKVRKWLNNNFTTHNEDGIRGIISYSFDTEEEMLEDLRNYMKGE